MSVTDRSGGISDLADILRIEATPLEERALPASTYAALRAVAAARPGQTALSFFPVLAALDRPETWSWGALLAEITRTANMLRAEGIGRGDVVAYLLPNLPQTHWTIWGGETAGIVMALNPALGAEELAALLAAAGAKMLVAAGPGIDPEIWDKAARAAGASGCVRQVLVVGPGAAPEAIGAIPVRDFDRLRAAHPAEALTFEPPGPTTSPPISAPAAPPACRRSPGAASARRSSTPGRSPRRIRGCCTPAPSPSAGCRCSTSTPSS